MNHQFLRYLTPLFVVFFFVVANATCPLMASAPASKAVETNFQVASKVAAAANTEQKKLVYRRLASVKRSVKSITAELLVTVGWPLAGLGMIVGGLLFASGAAAIAWIIAGSILLGLFLLFLAALASINIC